MTTRFAVWQDLFVEKVIETGTTLSVHLRDLRGERNLVNYQFLDRVERLLQRDILDGWRMAMTPLTYVRNGVQGVLLDDEAAFWQAYA
jgi:hypothetical protein